MKKLIVLGVVAALAILASSVAQADDMSTSKNVFVEILVQEVFGFTLWDNDLSQQFTLIPGDAAVGSIHIAASSNHSKLWWISASSSGTVGLYNGGVLPIKMTTLSGAGTKVTDLVLTGSAQAIYTAGTGEYPKAGVTIDGLFVVPTTLDTEQDVYQGTIALTMTD